MGIYTERDGYISQMSRILTPEEVLQRLADPNVRFEKPTFPSGLGMTIYDTMEMDWDNDGGG